MKNIKIDPTINTEALTLFLGLTSDSQIDRAEEWASAVFVIYFTENGKRKAKFVSKKNACYPASITYHYEGYGDIEMIRTARKGYQIYLNRVFNRYQSLDSVVKGFADATKAQIESSNLQFVF